MRRNPVLLATVAACALLSVSTSYAQPFSDRPSVDNPALAKYSGGAITLRNLEDYVSELPKLQRCPRLVDGAIWRKHMCEELGKSILFTSQALELGQHLEPSFLRARNYYIQEWSSYAILRDNVVNQVDVALPTLKEYYDLHKTDWYVSATVSLRMIRTRDAQKAASALERIRSGEPFEQVEKDVTQVSLLQRGKVHGPFPTTDTVTMIPPPREVIDAAFITPPGETTGPLFLNNNYFIVRTESQTAGRQLSFEDAVEFVETQVRLRQGDYHTRRLLDRLYRELNVQRDDAAVANPATRPDDIVATVGTTLIPYDEYLTLNGRVRGPALQASTLEPTPLARFIVPTLFAEAAKVAGYMEEPEFKKSLLFHDLRRIGTRMMNTLVDQLTPKVTEGDIRRYYNINKNTKDEHGHLLGSMSLEEMRGGIMELLHQSRRGETEARIQKQILEQGQFEMVEKPETGQPTAFEALVAAAGSIPQGHKVRMITSVTETENGTTAPTAMINCGRRSGWKIICSSDAEPGKIVEIDAPETARIYDGTDRFTSSPLYMPWNGVWRFDTDALARLAYENGMGDYLSKYRGNVHINTRVEFEWAGNMPQASWIVYEMRPLEGAEEDVLTLRFSGQYGSLSRKPLSECLPCEQMKRMMNDPI